MTSAAIERPAKLWPMPDQPGVGSVVCTEDEVFINLGCPNPHPSMCHAVDGWLAVGADLATTWTEMVWQYSKQLTVQFIADLPRGPVSYDDLLAAWTGPRRSRWYGPTPELPTDETPSALTGPAPLLRHIAGKDAGSIESIGWMHPSILDPFVKAYRVDPAAAVIEHALLAELDHFSSAFDPAFISLVYLRMAARRLRSAQCSAVLVDQWP